MKVIRKLNNEKLENIVWGIISFTAIIIFWQIIVTLIKAENFPPPTKVFSEFLKDFISPIGKYTLLGHIGWSLSRVLVGYCAAAVLGISIGLFMGWSKFFRALFKPVFDLLRPIPPIAWIPLSILWFGIGEKPKYFLIFIGAFTAFTLNAYLGAVKVDKQLIGAAKMLGATDKQVFRKVVLPSTVPQIFSGFQVALSNAWMAVLGAEMIRSSEGAGWIIIMGMESGNTPQMIVGMISIGITGFILATSMRVLERRLVAWNVRGK
ncbi:MAG TPA: ABC transporter permease [Clostridia bacterium]|nr:ABC transporter permease [Clostridia bacterium]